MVIANELISPDVDFPGPSNFIVPSLMNIQTRNVGVSEMRYWYGWSLGIRL